MGRPPLPKGFAETFQTVQCSAYAVFRGILMRLDVFSRNLGIIRSTYWENINIGDTFRVVACDV